MNGAFYSDLGQRISWTLVHSIWQFSVIAVVLATGLFLLRGRSPHMRYRCMLAAMSLMMIAPAVTSLLVSPVTLEADLQGASVEVSVLSEDRALQMNGQMPVSILPEAHNAYVESDELDFAPDPIVEGIWATSTKDSFRSLIVDFVQSGMNAILSGWLAGVLLLSTRPLIGWRATRALRSRGRSVVSDSITAATKRVAEHLGVRRAIDVAQSSLVEVPTLIGWLKPLVLLPVSAISGLSTSQLEAVIAHELAHVRRHDYLVNLFQLLMETVFFYHPAVWWVSHKMRVEREDCCDDIAANMTGDRVGYAKLLVWLEESRDPSTRSTLAMSADGGSLLSRVRRLVSTPTETTGIGPLASVIALTLFVVIGVFLMINPGQSVAQENGLSDDNRDRGMLQVSDSVSIKLLAMLPHQASADKVWRPDGSRFEHAPELPPIPSNSRTRKLSGFDFIFQYQGLEKNRNPVYHTAGLYMSSNVNADGFGTISVAPEGNPGSTTVKVGIPDEKWGPWVSVNRDGHVVAPVIITPPYRDAYVGIRPYGVEPSQDSCLFTYDRKHSDLAAIEVMAVDQEGARRSEWGVTVRKDEYGVLQNAKVFDHPIETFDHFEYRLRPYRYWILFENVSLEPGQTTSFERSVEPVAIPPADEKVLVFGRIVGPDGMPATTSGWMYYQVHQASGSYSQTLGEFADTFEFQSVPGECSIVHYASGFAPAWTPLMDTQNGDIVEGIVLKLKRGFETTAQVRDEVGYPIVDATVIIHPLIHGSTNGPNLPLRSNNAGEVSLEHLADTKYSFRVEAAGFEDLRTEPITIREDVLLVLTMQQAKPTTGVVLNPDGTPSAGAKLRMSIEVTQDHGSRFVGGNEGSLVAVTDDRGHFLLDQLSTASRYLFVIEASDGSRLLYRDFQAGQSDLTIQLPKRRDLRIELRGDLAPFFREGDKRYVNVRQSVSLNSTNGNIGGLMGGRAPIEPNSTGGTVIYRGLIVGPNANKDEQSVKVSFGTVKQKSRNFQLTARETNSVDWAIGELPESIENDTGEFNEEGPSLSPSVE